MVVEAILAANPDGRASRRSGEKSDLRYLLVRRAGLVKKNYDLSRTAQFLEPPVFNDTFNSHYQLSPKGMDIDVQTESTIRNGQVRIRTRLARSAESRAAESSPW